MLMRPFDVPSHNSYYEGEYSEKELRWRRVCALDKARNLQRLLGPRAVDSVLEVGCGTGAVLAEVARRGIGKRHQGVDMADPGVHLDPDAAGLQIAQYDGAVLPFADASFDLVFASHVLEHVPDPRSLLREMKRVSRQFIYIEVPCELHLRSSRDSLQRTLEIGHINAYTPEALLLQLQTAQLTVLDSELFDHSREVHAFASSPAKAWVKGAIRSGLLRASRRWASRCFTYHCGALCAAGPALAG